MVEPEVPAGPMTSTVAADTTWRGTLRSGASIRIDGDYEGQIETEQELVVTADAKVEATVHAASITVAGQLNGQINCQGRLEILPTGRVSGQIDAGKFVVHEGAYLGGQVRMTSAANADGGNRPMLQRVR
jgi:cytoskeletal protein CcmA (bactofilin family)